jgi:ribosomal protein L4
LASITHGFAVPTAVVNGSPQNAVWRSSRNIKGSHYRVASDLNAYEILKAKWLIFEEGALAALEERFSG